MAGCEWLARESWLIMLVKCIISYNYSNPKLQIELFLPKIVEGSNPQYFVKVTLFGNRVFGKIVKLK